MVPTSRERTHTAPHNTLDVLTKVALRHTGHRVCASAQVLARTDMYHHIHTPCDDSYHTSIIIPRHYSRLPLFFRSSPAFGLCIAGVDSVPPGGHIEHWDCSEVEGN